MRRIDYLIERNKKIKKEWNKFVKKGFLAKQIINIFINKYKLSRRQIYNIVMN